MRLVPDPDTFAVLPWRSDGEDGSAAARIICDIVTTEGEPFEGGPRQVLKRVLSKADDMGYTVSIGRSRSSSSSRRTTTATRRRSPRQRRLLRPR